MTSTLSTAYEKLIDNPWDDSSSSSPTPPPLSTLVPATESPPLSPPIPAAEPQEQLTHNIKTSVRKELSIGVATKHGLPGVDITESSKTDLQKSSIHDPTTKSPPLPTPLPAAKLRKQLTNNKKPPVRKELSIGVATKHGLPDVDITELSKTDLQKSLVRESPRLLIPIIATKPASLPLPATESPLPPPPIPTTTSQKQLTNNIKLPVRKELSFGVATKLGLPDVDITELSKTDPQKSLIRESPPLSTPIPPTKSPPPPTPISAAKPRKLLTNDVNTSVRKELSIGVATKHGLPGVDIAELSKTDPQKSLIRDPAERNLPRLIVNEDVIKQTIYAPTNLDNNQNIETKQNSNEDLSNKTTKLLKPFKKRQLQKHQIVQIVEDEPPIDEYWKKEILVDDQGVVAIEPIEYDKDTYEGPFGLTRKGSFIFYISMGIFTLLSAVFLIMTSVFYSQNYPSSSSKPGLITGIAVCAFSFYLGVQLLLIGLWHQKLRQEDPIKKMKKSKIHNKSTKNLKTSMENNEKYDYSYQPPIDYTSYNPPYVSNVNEQMLLQQPNATKGIGYYDSVVWPSHVEVESQPDMKFFQPMEWSLGPQQPSTTVNESLLTGIDASISNTNLVKQAQHQPIKPTEAQPIKPIEALPIKPTEAQPIKPTEAQSIKPIEAQSSVGDFSNLQLNSTVIEQPLPILSKAPETDELINSIPQMELNAEKPPTNGDVSPKKNNQIKSVDTITDVSSSTARDKHHHHHRRHHHHRHYPHHHHHHHHRRRRSRSPDSPSTYSSYTSHRHHGFGHHHHYHSVPLPRITTPRFPKIVTPNAPKSNTIVYRETGINTGKETKIMRDSSVTANLEDIPTTPNNRLDKIPVVRRTIIVEPYPAQPTSQIVVKPRVDMVGKIRLGKNIQLDGDNETIVYPSSAFFTKPKLKKKKNSTMDSDSMIEDLQLEDINDDDDDIGFKISNRRTSTIKTIRNAFYN